MAIDCLSLTVKRICPALTVKRILNVRNQLIFKYKVTCIIMYMYYIFIQVRTYLYVV